MPRHPSRRPRIAARLAATAAALLIPAGLCVPVAQATTSARPTVSGPRLIDSTGALGTVLSRELRRAGGQSSALVVDQSTGRTLYAHDATVPRLPASVEKLFTTSAALFDLGASHRFSTQILGDGTLSHGTFSGTLFLRGGGDPSFGDAHFDATMYGTGATMQSLLARLHTAGVDRISGRVLGDPSIFDDLAGGPDTGYRANLETEGELSGLAYDAGFTSSAETALQPHPAAWAARALTVVAPLEGITIAPHTRTGAGFTTAHARLLASVASPTLATLIRLTNTPSDNFFAETLTKDLAAATHPPGSTATGAQLIAATDAARLGLPVHADDGSGLSRADSTTATTVVQLLEEMEPSPAFMGSLAVAGVSGTMIDEMLHTRGAGNCRGKTGTLHDVASLVGVCTAADGHRLVFAFLENGLHDATYGHETEDAMGEALADYDGEGAGRPAPRLPHPDAGAAVPR